MKAAECRQLREEVGNTRHPRPQGRGGGTFHAERSPVAQLVPFIPGPLRGHRVRNLPTSIFEIEILNLDFLKNKISFLLFRPGAGLTLTVLVKVWAGVSSVPFARQSFDDFGVSIRENLH